MKYKVELRDKDGKLYRDSNGILIRGNDLCFNEDSVNERTVRSICENTARIYEAITKEGTDITIEVSDFNSISGTWMVLYSYYHTEKRFVKH